MTYGVILFFLNFELFSHKWFIVIFKVFGLKIRFVFVVLNFECSAQQCFDKVSANIYDISDSDVNKSCLYSFWYGYLR